MTCLQCIVWKNVKIRALKCSKKHFSDTIHCKHVIFTILYVFPFQIYPPRKTVYIHKIRNYLPFWHREVSEKVFLRALYSKFSHFSIQYIANMSFSQFCMYFRFKYTPLVNTTMVYEKGSIYVFLASRSFGESVS